MKVLVVSGLSDAKLYSKLQPLLAIEMISEINLVRRKPLAVVGIKDYCPPIWIRKILPLAECYRLFMLFWLCLWKRPDRVIAFYMVPHGVYGWLVGSIFRIKIIQLLVGTDLERVLRSRMLLFILRSAHRIGLRGKTTFAKLKPYRIDGGRVFYPPNVFNVDEYLPDEAVEKEFDFLFLGDLVQPKQLEMLIKSVAVLKKSQPHVRVALVGDGVLRNKLEELAASLQVDKNVFFLGAIEPVEVSRYLNRAKVFIMTSRIEGLPMAMIEALSCGLPVIMPDVGDVTLVAVHSRNSLIVSPATETGFAGAMKSLMEDRALYDRLKEGAINTRELFNKEYSLRAAIRIWRYALELKKS